VSVRAALGRAGRMCLALPEVEEAGAHGTSSYRYRGKGFAYVWADHHGVGRPALWVRAPPGAQEELLDSEPERFFRPPYVGPSGWIGVWLDGQVDWPGVAEVLVDGYLDRIGARAAGRLDPGGLVATLRAVAERP
jgi:hypothetical protein